MQVGDMPPGKMSWKLENMHCDGFPKDKTWSIHYSFKAGTNPITKEKFSNDSRNAYLPDTQQGREILALLVKSFRRRLTFTVGFSVTRNIDHVIVWNGIHHKTTTNGGSTHYGYPDPSYFTRVRQELQLKGITHASV